MAIRQVSFAAPQQQSPLVQALAPRSPLSMISAQALQEGTSTAPVQSIGEGLARLGQAGLGGWFAGAEKRRADEASGRLADAILGSMTPEQRAGPQGQLLATALRDPNAGPALSAAYLQNSMTPRETWTPDPTGMFQVSSMTGERRPLESPERARAISDAQRDPNSRYQIVPGTDGQPPLVVDRSQLGQSGPPAQGANPLAGAESSGRAGVVNPLGYSGLYQFGAPRLAELGMYQPGPGEDLRNWQPGQAQWSGRISIPGMPDIQTQQQFLASPEAQQAAFRAHLDNIDQRLGPVAQQMQGQTVGGVPITPNSLRAMAHLGGIDGVYRFLSTNGQYNPADRNGTSLSDYGRRFANVDIRQGVQTAQAQPQTATDAAPGPQYPPGVRPLIQGNQGPTTTQFNRANTLRDEYTRGSQTFQTVQDAYQNIRSAASNSTGAGDMSMLYSFVKLLDPTSVVRESEFATAAASGSLGERIQGLYQRIVSGERLPDSLRRDFMREAEAIYRTHTTAQRRRQDEYGRIARMYGVDPSGVTVDFTRPELQTPWEPPAPPAPTQPVPAQPAAQPAAPPSTPIPQPGVGTGQQVPIPPMPTEVAPQPAVPPRGTIPREQILEELRRRGLQAR